MRSVREGALTEWFAQQRDQLSVSVVGAWDPDSRFARSCEAEIFHRAFGNTVEDLEREHGKYDARSFYLFVTERGSGDAAGFMRITLPTSDGSSKSLDDISKYWMVPQGELRIHGMTLSEVGGVIDIATLGVTQPRQGSGRSGAVTLFLYQACVATLKVAGWGSAVAILDSRLYRALAREFARPWTLFDGLEPLPYLGCPRAYPVVCVLKEWEARLAATEPAMKEVVCGCVDLPLMEEIARVVKVIDERVPAAEIRLDPETTIVAPGIESGT